VSGLVDKPFEIGFDDLLAKMQLEERVYRHRCVETWSMVRRGRLPDEVAGRVLPHRHGYVVMQTSANPRSCRARSFSSWPYTEGLAIDEATHDLAFIATGLCDKPQQNGAPLGSRHRSAASRASRRRQHVHRKTPVSWVLADNEYGFWANVNPKVPHPRWSQATEKPLGSDERVPTQLYNGYADFVAGLYESRKSEKLFM
jgi:sulfoxide reductase catalytic subunit YedY